MEKNSTERKTAEGLPISSSQVRRLEREVKALKENYDSLKIKTLTMQGIETDPAKIKNDANKLEGYRKSIRQKEQQIIEIKLALK
jgi:uncharacterized protein involved in exopolysaccharide biosynthesis